MRRTSWSVAVLGLLAFAAVLAAGAPPSYAQMCMPAAAKDCEREADAEARRCVVQCARYDDICADRCDDTHDTGVHYCWIKSGICKAAVDSQGVVQTWSERR